MSVLSIRRRQLAAGNPSRRDSLLQSVPDVVRHQDRTAARNRTRTRAALATLARRALRKRPSLMPSPISRLPRADDRPVVEPVRVLVPSHRFPPVEIEKPSRRYIPTASVSVSPECQVLRPSSESHSDLWPSDSRALRADTTGVHGRDGRPRAARQLSPMSFAQRRACVGMGLPQVLPLS